MKVDLVCSRLGAAFVLTLAGCEVDLQRMIDQPSVRVYEAAFDDGASWRGPEAPAGTVARDEPLEPKARTAENGASAEIPIQIDRHQLEQGGEAYRVYCAPCHGARGDGVSVVAEHMMLARPPSLLVPPVSGLSAREIYDVVTEGYGLMPDYRDALDSEQRWAVVAFVDVLRLSQYQPLAELAPWIRKEFDRR